MAEKTVKKDERGNFKLPPELHKRIKIASATARVSMQAIVAEAWEIYEAVAKTDSALLKSGTFNSNPAEKTDSIYGFDGDTSESSLGASQQWQRLQGLLGVILSSKNQIAINAITSNLIAFSDLVHAVPEAVYDPARVAHAHNEVASIQQQVLDSISDRRDGQALGKQKPTGSDAADRSGDGKRNPKPRKTAGG